MKASIFTIILAVAAAGLYAEDATVSYLEGGVNLKNAAGKLTELDFGSPVKIGESVITKRDGRADLELANKSTITVSPNSVFTMGEMEVNGKKESVFSAPLGKVAFKFTKFTGNEPKIRTSSAAMGVRGTEFTVYSGMDGSSLLVVTTGAVELESAGKTVALEPNEAVEVRPGEQPGAKFKWIGKELDFSAWNKGKQDEFLKDPVGAIKRVETQLEYYKSEMEVLIPAFNKLTLDFNTSFEELKKIVESKDQERAVNYRKNVFDPIREQRGAVILNIRYYALSYLSLRRFVVGNMYMNMKTRALSASLTDVYQKFNEVYSNIVAVHEKAIVPQLNENDI